MLAAQNGHTSVIKALLDAKANPNITDKVRVYSSNVWLRNLAANCICIQTAGWSALFFAAKLGNLTIVQLLIARGAKVDLRDKVTWIVNPWRLL